MQRAPPDGGPLGAAGGPGADGHAQTAGRTNRGADGYPQGQGQKPGTRLGRVLRIDVNGAAPFAVPPDNPFVGRAGALPDTWAHRLRPPRRFSFDPATGIWEAAVQVPSRGWAAVEVVAAV